MMQPFAKAFLRALGHPALWLNFALCWGMMGGCALLLWGLRAVIDDLMWLLAAFVVFAVAVLVPLALRFQRRLPRSPFKDFAVLPLPEKAAVCVFVTVMHGGLCFGPAVLWLTWLLGFSVPSFPYALLLGALWGAMMALFLAASAVRDKRLRFALHALGVLIILWWY
ncbi:MAG: hypothetical protein ACK4PK_06600 [Alphaproteobacteria bacterium]|jgi:hypothetical protein